MTTRRTANSSRIAEDNTWFRIVPTTGRSAEILARRHGYKTAQDLADSLPSHAKVLDVGAGASPLGSVVARLRPDIHWINLDFGYYDAQILADASRDAPSNLVFTQGDVTKLDEYIQPASMDAIFSYWLFPHLSLYDEQTALTAAEQMFKAVKPGGTLIVGPRRQPIYHPATLLSRSWQVKKDKALAPAAYSHEVLRRTQLGATNRKLRLALDIAAIELFGTSRYIKDNKIYDPKTHQYIPRYHPVAIRLVGRLLLITANKLIHSDVLSTDS